MSLTKADQLQLNRKIITVYLRIVKNT